MHNVIKSWGYEEAEPMSMYTDIFRLGEGLIQKNGEPSGNYKTNPIIIGKIGKYAIKRIMFEDEFESLIKEFQEYEWAYLSGLTYWGRDNTAANQSKMYAMIFDLDGVTKKTLGSLLDGISIEFYPVPNYIVLSGHGLHLYYIFERPVALYPNIKSQLKRLKFALTDIIWNRNTSTDRAVQHQGINQAYRIAGGKTKVKGVRARAFKISSHPTTLEYLNGFVEPKYRIDESALYRESRMSLEEARELYPEWYERRIVRGEKPGTWKTNRALYDWWKAKMFEGAVCGHRYYCVMALAIFAIKCGIDESELREDAHHFVKMLNELNPDQPFFEADVESALDCYDERYITFPRKDLEKLTGIPMPERKRNHRDRQTHLQADWWSVEGETVENPCKKNRESALKEMRENGLIKGRPKGSGTKEAEVLAYFAEHPESTVRSAVEALGISKSTVQKWKPRKPHES